MGDKWVFPVSANKLTQLFHSGHYAIDIGLITGSPLYAPTNATVQSVTNSPTGYGRHIILKTQDGKTIILAHLSSFAVNPGDKVSAGQMIGRTGSTGNSTGPHLHYEVRGPKGERIDPLKIGYGTTNYPGATKPTQAPTPTQATTNKRPPLVGTPVFLPGGTKPTAGKEQLQTAQAAGELPNTPQWVNSVNSTWQGLNIDMGNITVGLIGLVLIIIGAVGIIRPAINSATKEVIGAAVKAAV